MKKILTLLVLVTSTFYYSQVTLSSYSMNYFPGEKYEIQSDNPTERNAKIYLGVSPKEKIIKKIDILIPLSDIDKFKSDILNCKEIYINWKKTAIDNNVTELDKEMIVKFSKYDIAFLYGSKWNIDFSKAITPRFKIINGKYLFILSNEYELTSSSNKFMTTKGFYLVLNDEQEFDMIIKSLDTNNINELFNSKKKTDELFN
ncbi:hypothetical protein MP478_04310 [Chryseobacterium sp. WG14]|uniref:hypothetical protein n=1 Tax=Chryseobacterium sp. WG14 TaxID=2926909 RepID=UPI00211E745E|nr:hypothetical protein [Chryseobacterium sp. WG14]MCQ9638603.1 hypothetical protein [Chryseobacterium sp. WG14]